MAPNGAGKIFVPTNPDPADILVRMNFDFEDFVFGFVGTQISGFPGGNLSFPVLMGPLINFPALTRLAETVNMGCCPDWRVAVA